MKNEEYYIKLSNMVEWIDDKPYWKVRVSRARRAGDPAGSMNNCGYGRVCTTVDGVEREVPLHRLRFYMEYGYLPDPPLTIDHINGDRLDNRIENLRVASPTQQLWNQAKRPGCSSKYKGVRWHKGSKRWEASVRVDGKKVYLGMFKNEEDARDTYIAKAKEIHGEFFRN